MSYLLQNEITNDCPRKWNFCCFILFLDVSPILIRNYTSYAILYHGEVYDLNGVRKKKQYAICFHTTTFHTHQEQLQKVCDFFIQFFKLKQQTM